MLEHAAKKKSTESDPAQTQVTQLSTISQHKTGKQYSMYAKKQQDLKHTKNYITSGYRYRNEENIA